MVSGNIYIGIPKYHITMREKQEWVKLIARYPNSLKGGGLVKIDSETLRIALDNAGIDIDRVMALKVKRFPLKDVKGTAKIVLKLKVDK